MSNTVTRFENPPVRGFLHRPDGRTRAGLAITHGAGGNSTAPLLIAVANAFCTAGYCALRFDLPFRQRRPYGPPHAATAAEDRAGVQAAIERLRSEGLERVFAGGHSYGGRQASMLAAADPHACDGLLLLSYPLHPPNKPEQLRTQHFPSLHVSALFVHGTADPFASPEELAAAVQPIPSAAQMVFIDGAGHDLKRGKFDIAARVVEPFTAMNTQPLPK